MKLLDAEHLAHISHGRQGDIVHDRVIDQQGLIVTVFGRICDRMVDCSVDVIDLCAVRQCDGSGTVKGGAEAGFSDFMHTTLTQAADPEDLALVKLKGNIVDLIADRNVLDLQRNLIRDLLAVIGTIVMLAEFTADHQFLQVIRRDILRIDGVDILAVSQDRDTVTHLQDLIQVMGNEDYAAAQITKSAHVLEQFHTSAVVQGCGGLIDNQDLRIEVG